MKYILSVAVSFCCVQAAWSQISIQTAVADTLGDPDQLYIRVQMPDLTLQKVQLASLNDVDNSQVFTFYFDGCPVTQILKTFDTTVDIPAIFPYKLVIRVIHDTSVSCPYPVQPIVSDSVVIPWYSVTSVDPVFPGNHPVFAYPNPAKGILTMDIPAEIKPGEVYLHDLNGRQVKTWAEFKPELNITDVPAGCYFLFLETAQGMWSQKILIEKSE